MAYADLLRDPRWQRKRLEVMQRDDFACTACGDRETTLNVHHTYYTKGHKPWEYDTDSLKTLCQPCHGMVTEDTAEIQKYLGELSPDALQRALGYVRGLAIRARWPDQWALCDDTTPRVPFNGIEEQVGTALALGLNESEAYYLDVQVADSLGWEEVRAIFAARVEAGKRIWEAEQKAFGQGCKAGQDYEATKP